MSGEGLRQDAPAAVDGTGDTEGIGDTGGTAQRSWSRMWWGIALMIVAACLPPAAQLGALSRISTLLWLASMPLCLAGAVLAGQGIIALRAQRRAAEEREAGLL
ncbi:hypothetical protein ACSL103130_12030 [Actinomyces slackii]|uniref:Uncharacterized protein n=1 Tax=Actinomyces slackii TaxID=52774 RepID=A0A448KC98_9ACTO|nr:hypothetical protein [Actinomyces slackii]VEG74559.1 Uncharacterised protein [Actinomyces slackii]